MISNAAQRMAQLFPQWTKPFYDPENSNTIKFLNVFGKQIDDIEALIKFIANAPYLIIDGNDFSFYNIDYIYKLEVPINQIGDMSSLVFFDINNQNIPQEVLEANTIFEFYTKKKENGKLEENIFYYDAGTQNLYTKKEYSKVEINGAIFTHMKEHHVWGIYDEIGLLLGCPRIPGERNERYVQRILDVFSSMGNATEEGLKNYIARSLDINKDLIITKEINGQFIEENMLGGISNALSEYISLSNKLNLSDSDTYWEVIEDNARGLEFLPIPWREIIQNIPERYYRNGVVGEESLEIIPPILEEDIFSTTCKVAARVLSHSVNETTPEVSVNYSVISEGYLPDPNGTPYSTQYKYSVIGGEKTEINPIIQVKTEYNQTIELTPIIKEIELVETDTVSIKYTNTINDIEKNTSEIITLIDCAISEGNIVSDSGSSGASALIPINAVLNNENTLSSYLSLEFSAIGSGTIEVSLLESIDPENSIGVPYIAYLTEEAKNYIYHFYNISQSSIDERYIKITFSNANSSIGGLKLNTKNDFLFEKSDIAAFTSPVYHDDTGENFHPLMYSNEEKEISITSLNSSGIYESIIDDVPYWMDLSDKDLMAKISKVFLPEDFRKENPKIELKLDYQIVNIYDGGSLYNSNVFQIYGGITETWDEEDSNWTKDTASVIFVGGSLAASKEYLLQVKNGNQKYVQYGTGIITIEDGVKALPFSKTFWPEIPWSEDKSFSFYITPGHTLSHREYISTEWNYPDGYGEPSPPMYKRNIYEPEDNNDIGGQIYISLKEEIIESNSIKVRKVIATINRTEDEIDDVTTSISIDSVPDPFAQFIENEYSDTEAYDVGDFVYLKIGEIKTYYRCIEEPTIGAFDPTKWEEWSPSFTTMVEITSVSKNSLNLPKNLISMSYGYDGSIFKVNLSSLYKEKNILSEYETISLNTISDIICTSKNDFVSEWIPFTGEDEEINSAKIILNIDNPNLKAYVDTQGTGQNRKYRITITSNDYNPKTNYKPKIKDGIYSIGREKYLLLTNTVDPININSSLPEYGSILFEKDGDRYLAKKEAARESIIDPIIKSANVEQKSFELTISPYPSEFLFPGSTIHPSDSII